MTRLYLSNKSRCCTRKGCHHFCVAVLVFFFFSVSLKGVNITAVEQLQCSGAVISVTVTCSFLVAKSLALKPYCSTTDEFSIFRCFVCLSTITNHLSLPYIFDTVLYMLSLSQNGEFVCDLEINKKINKIKWCLNLLIFWSRVRNIFTGNNPPWNSALYWQTIMNINTQLGSRSVSVKLHHSETDAQCHEACLSVFKSRMTVEIYWVVRNSKP